MKEGGGGQASPPECACPPWPPKASPLILLPGSQPGVQVGPTTHLQGWVWGRVPHRTLVYQPLCGSDSLGQTKHPPKAGISFLGSDISSTVEVHSFCCSAKPRAHP